MKKLTIIPTAAIVLASTLSAQVVLTWDSGDQARTEVTSVSTTPAQGGSSSIGSQTFGWKNNGTDALFNQVMWFDTTNVPGFAADLSDLTGQTVEMSFAMPALNGGQTASLYYATYTNVTSATLLGWGMPGTLESNLIASGLNGNGVLTYDVTSTLGAAAGAEKNRAFFTLKIDSPASNPATGTTVIDFDWSGATLTIVPEPSTYALLAGFAVFGLIMFRRRQELK